MATPIVISEFGTLGGQSVLCPLAMRNGIDEVLDESWDVRESHYRFWSHANAFTTRLGCEPGHGYVLMTRTALNAIDINTELDFVIGGGDYTQTLKVVIRHAARFLPQDRIGQGYLDTLNQTDDTTSV